MYALTYIVYGPALARLVVDIEKVLVAGVKVIKDGRAVSGLIYALYVISSSLHVLVNV